MNKRKKSLTQSSQRTKHRGHREERIEELLFKEEERPALKGGPYGNAEGHRAEGVEADVRGQALAPTTDYERITRDYELRN